VGSEGGDDAEVGESEEIQKMREVKKLLWPKNMGKTEDENDMSRYETMGGD